jgi:hypothetical protein
MIPFPPAILSKCVESTEAGPNARLFFFLFSLALAGVGRKAGWQADLGSWAVENRLTLWFGKRGKGEGKARTSLLR